MLASVAGVIGLVVGFGLGRVKNAGKIAAVKAEILKVEGSAVSEVRALVAAVKIAAKL